VKEFKSQAWSWLKGEDERDYMQRMEGLKEECEQRLRSAHISDHGLLDYLVDLWD